MLQKTHIITKAKEPPSISFSDKEFLDLICDFLVDDIIKKVNNDKKESDRLCED